MSNCIKSSRKWMIRDKRNKKRKINRFLRKWMKQTNRLLKWNILINQDYIKYKVVEKLLVFMIAID